jgi:coproporphyrinogen III oxidase-like Fe-S oxidoreductase
MPLAPAKRQGRLHRNFQGYSTQPDCDLIALGVSAIGRMGATYSQNAKTLPSTTTPCAGTTPFPSCEAWRSRATTWCAVR